MRQILYQLPDSKWRRQMPLSGGCSCGAVRLAVEHCLYAQLCHCDACKKRTGSAYGISVVIDNAALLQFRGETRTFRRNAESGNPVEYDFCPACGSTVRWRVAALQDRQVIAGGAFDDLGAFVIAGEMYTTKALPWARIGCEITTPGEPDPAYRSALIRKRSNN
jgi:hypothetical protein